MRYNREIFFKNQEFQNQNNLKSKTEVEEKIQTVRKRTYVFLGKKKILLKERYETVTVMQMNKNCRHQRSQDLIAVEKDNQT